MQYSGSLLKHKATKIKLIALSVSSGILFSFGWPPLGIPFLLFFAFLPLLFIEDYILKNKSSKSSLYLYSIIAFFIWNLSACWWIANASIVGMIAAVLFNSSFMAFVFYLFHICRRNYLPKHQSYIILVFFFIAMEYLQLRMEIAWPWLNMGDSFAIFPDIIQWYEYTGSQGGSLWILLVNIAVFYLYKSIKENNNRTIFNLISAIALIIIPIAVSYIILSNYEETENPVEIVIVQPNVDPYEEQFSQHPSELIQRNIDLARKKTDSSVSFVVLPESAIMERVWERKVNNSYCINSIRDFLNIYPNAAFISGAKTLKKYEKYEKLKISARKFKNYDIWYDVFNSSLLIDNSSNVQVSHKSILVPGVEKMTFSPLFKFLEKYAVDMGGIKGTLGTDDNRQIFEKDSLKVAALICYESVYGYYCSEFVKEGASIIFIITNDGWWGNTAGHIQHKQKAVIRAIENRRSVARSANTGISCFINQKGRILESISYGKADVIRQKLNANTKLTFYTVYGDYIGRVSLFSAMLVLLIFFATIIRKKRRLIR